jgi:hypothetical protein
MCIPEMPPGASEQLVDGVADILLTGPSDLFPLDVPIFEQDQRGDGVDAEPDALPANSLATSSTVGPSFLHGPHHGAQKSTRTGISEFCTVSSNVVSESSITFPAMTYPFCAANNGRLFPKGARHTTFL